MTHKQGFAQTPKAKRVFHVSPAPLPSYTVAKGRRFPAGTIPDPSERAETDPEALRVSGDVAEALLAGRYDDILGLSTPRRP